MRDGLPGYITFAFAFALACAPACGSDEASQQRPVDAGPPKTNASLPFAGDPSGLFWDGTTSTLFIADDANNRVATYRDAEGFGSHVTLPAGGTGLGQLLRLTDGTVLVTRLGTGANGDVVAVTPDRKSAPIAGLDPARLRTGLTLAPDGRIFDAYTNAAGGSVAELSLSGTEIEIVSGLQKPNGLLAAGETLAIADTGQGKLLKTKLAALGPLTPGGDLPNIGPLCAGPSGTLAGAGDSVKSLDATGTPTTIATGFAAVRGVAYDPKYRRIFVANHVGSSGNTIEIRPVP